MRRLGQNSEQNDFFVLKLATQGLLDKIRERPEFKSKSKIEILADMQHQRNPSILIDFTSEILSALFFAFDNDNFSTENDKNNPIGFVSIYFKELKNKFINNNIDFEKKEEFSESIYICPKNINRGISQKSYFILDENKNYNKIKISYKLKNEIIKFLKKENVSNESVFPDVYGIYKEYFKKDPVMLFIQGNALSFVLDRDKEAIEKYKKAIEINPNYAEAYSGWGVVLGKQNYFDEAIEKFKKAIEINPNYAAAYFNWGFALDKNDVLDEAIKKYEKAIEINPKHADAYFNWGAVLGKNNVLDEAIEKFKKAIEINPNYAAAYFNWGVALGKNDVFDEAIKKYEKAIEINPNYVDAYFNWGAILIDEKGVLDEAIKKFKKAIEINPKYADAYFGWGVALGKKGVLDEAVEKFKKAIKINPKHAAAYFSWGVVLDKNGVLDEAIKKIEKAISMDPENKEYKNLFKKIEEEIKKLN